METPSSSYAHRWTNGLTNWSSFIQSSGGSSTKFQFLAEKHGEKSSVGPEPSAAHDGTAPIVPMDDDQTMPTCYRGTLLAAVRNNSRPVDRANDRNRQCSPETVAASAGFRGVTISKPRFGRFPAIGKPRAPSSSSYIVSSSPGHWITIRRMYPPRKSNHGVARNRTKAIGPRSHGAPRRGLIN